VEAEQRKRIKDFSKEILFLSPTEQVYLSKLWVKGLRGNYSLVGRIADIWLKSWYGRTKSEEWMEGRLEKDMTLTPKRLAYECRYYKRLKRELTPWLIYLARKVKKRMLVRRRKVLMEESCNGAPLEDRVLDSSRKEGDNG
jgi:hypothetical protein